MRTDILQSEIDDVLNQCADQINECGSKWPGMTYEQGVKATLEWLFEEQPNPIED